ITLPTMPQINEINAPVKPEVNLDIDIPDAPDIVLPELAELEKLEVPDFEMPESDFDPSNHPYEELEIELYDVENPDWDNWWEEPDEYESEIFDALVKQ